MVHSGVPPASPCTSALGPGAPSYWQLSLPRCPLTAPIDAVRSPPDNTTHAADAGRACSAPPPPPRPPVPSPHHPLQALLGWASNPIARQKRARGRCLARRLGVRSVEPNGLEPTENGNPGLG